MHSLRGMQGPYILFFVSHAITERNRRRFVSLEAAPYDMQLHLLEDDSDPCTVRDELEGRVVRSGENPSIHHHDADFEPIGVAESSA